MYYIPPEIVDPEATPIYQNWDSDNIIDTVGNRDQYDASTNPDNVLIYRWNMEYQVPSKGYFWIKNLSNETANVTMTNYTTAEYRVKGTESWTGFSMSTNNVAPGQTIEIRRAGTLMHPGTISCNKTFSVGGNVMSLLYGDDFEGKELPEVSNGTPLLFRNLLQNNTTLIDASTLILPLNVQTQCYEDMFQGDTSLLYPPMLEATVMAKQCYEKMFYGCESLVYAPDLPATTLAEGCYYQMFRQCQSLTEPPELPATTLAEGCYANMFYDCLHLTEAPELPATTLAESCYSSMFYQCAYMTSVPDLDASILAKNCYNGMFSGCTSITEAPDLPATTLAEGCYANMFANCSRLTSPPVISATTLANACCQQMFMGCTMLTTAPILNALTLVTNCYYRMFYGCTSLNYIKAMFLTAPTLNYTYQWVRNVASSGTFVKNSSATWLGYGTDGVPSGWTVQTASS